MWAGRMILAAFCVVAFGSVTMAGRKAQRETTNTVTTTDGTGNLSKQRRDELVKKLGAIRSFLETSTDTNAVRLLQFAAELEKEVRTKKYGLVFEEHKERVDVELEHNLPVLTENKKRFIDNGGEVNFLIEGDNLAALKLLEKTHRGKIDLIYIDPPYNTGNKDFMYNDSYVDASDAFRHSKWLSFMKSRLEGARTLLSDKGVIFISINDCELAQLRILCDEVFDESNFIGQLTWESTTQPTNAGKAKFELQKKVESILCFARSKSKKPPFLLCECDSERSYPHVGKFGKCRFEVIEKSDAGAYRRDTMKFKILGRYPREGKRWQIGESTARALERAEKVEIVDGIVKKAVYPEDEVGKGQAIPFWSHFTAVIVGTGQNGKRELHEILGRDVGFDTVKPVSLIEELINHFPDDVLALDFFAGSGTTGHAVMNLNAKDGGKRKFILVTNNENGICEKVMYERLKRVIAKEGYAARLKYYKIDYVPIDEKVYYEYANELLKHTQELVELENGVDFSKDKSIAIVLTDKEAAQFAADEKRMAKCKAVYVGHDVLMRSEDKKAIKRRGIEIKIIPQYYYPELEG